MKKIYTLAAIVAFSGSALASEGYSAFDNINAALSVGSQASTSFYSYSEGHSIWDDASHIARIETLTAPVAVGDIDRFYSEDSALGSLLNDE